MSEAHESGRDPFGTPPPPPPKRRSIFTPFTCCLGCGGCILLVTALLLFVGYRFFVAYTGEKPLEFAMEPVPAQTLDRAEKTAEKLKTDQAVEVSFTASELNAIFQKALKENPILKEAGAKIRIDFEPGDLLHFRFTMPINIKPLGMNLATRHLNVDFLGEFKVENGEVVIPKVEKFVFGESDFSANKDDLRGVIGQITAKFETMEEGKKESDFDRFVNRIELLQVKGGKLLIKLKPESPPAKK